MFHILIWMSYSVLASLVIVYIICTFMSSARREENGKRVDDQ